jgi:hypothetical protein
MISNRNQSGMMWLFTTHLPPSSSAPFPDADRFPLDFLPHTRNTEITDIVIEKACSVTSLNTNPHYLQF